MPGDTVVPMGATIKITVLSVTAAVAGLPNGYPIAVSLILHELLPVLSIDQNGTLSCLLKMIRCELTPSSIFIKVVPWHFKEWEKIG